MAGTESGGKQAAITNKQRYGVDYYRVIGAAGGARSHGGGFSVTTVGKDGLTGPERARIAGAKGGRASRRKRFDYDLAA